MTRWFPTLDGLNLPHQLTYAITWIVRSIYQLYDAPPVTRQSIGAAAAGANADITSLTALASIAQEAWSAASLDNLWVNVGAPYPDAGYMKDREGFVHVRGAIKDGTFVDDTSMFTLPAGYRPEAYSAFPIITDAGAAGVIVRDDGTVRIQQATANTFVSLEGICFKAV